MSEKYDYFFGCYDATDYDSGYQWDTKQCEYVIFGRHPDTGGGRVCGLIGFVHDIPPNCKSINVTLSSLKFFDFNNESIKFHYSVIDLGSAKQNGWLTKYEDVDGYNSEGTEVVSKNTDSISFTVHKDFDEENTLYDTNYYGIIMQGDTSTDDRGIVKADEVSIVYCDSDGKPLKVYIVYDANGGANPPTSDYAYKTTTYTISDIVPTRDKNTDTYGFVITGDANGGNSDVSTVAICTKVSTYNFLGWGYNSSASDAMIFEPGCEIPIIDDAITFYAIWEEKTSTSYQDNTLENLPNPSRDNENIKYTITLDTSDCTLGTNNVLISSKEANYTFKGWGSNKNSSEVLSINTAYTEDATVYAIWESSVTDNSSVPLPTPSKNADSTSYTITFDPNGGNCDVYSMAGGGSTSYTFDGWSTDGTSANKVLSPYTPTQDITLYPLWKSSPSNGTVTLPTPTRESEDNGYIITFNANGGVCEQSSLQCGKKTTYTFKGWSTDGTTINVSSPYTPTKDITLYAIWSSSISSAGAYLPTPTRAPDVTKHNIKLDPTGGSCNVSIMIGSTTKSYTFKYWGTSPSAYVPVSSPYTPTKDITLYAIWEGSDEVHEMISLPTPTRSSDIDGSYVVTLDTDGGLAFPQKLYSNIYKNYTFDGWSTDGTYANKVYSPSSYRTTQDVTLYALWKTSTSNKSVSLPDATKKADEYKYNIRLDANGGSVQVDSLYASKSTEYKFEAWSIDGSSNNTVSSPYTPSADITLHALWSSTQNENSVSLPDPIRSNDETKRIITLNSNGGICSYNELVANIITAYKFEGWSTDGTIDTIITNPHNYMIFEDIDLVAIWTSSIIEDNIKVDLPIPTKNLTKSEDNGYTITLNPNGGTVESESIIASEITKYIFNCWSTDNTINGAVDLYYTALEDITLYAIWDTTNHIDSVELPAAEKDNFIFSGWSTSPDSIEFVPSPYTPTSTITLYAKWTLDISMEMYLYHNGNWWFISVS